MSKKEAIEIEEFLGEHSMSPIWDYEVYLYFPKLCKMELGMEKGVCYYA